MSPEEEVEKLMTAVGALGELGHAMFLSFQKAGFEHDDALEMSAKILTDLMRPR